MINLHTKIVQNGYTAQNTRFHSFFHISASTAGTSVPPDILCIIHALHPRIPHTVCVLTADEKNR